MTSKLELGNFTMSSLESGLLYLNGTGCMQSKNEVSKQKLFLLVINKLFLVLILNQTNNELKHQLADLMESPHNQITKHNL
jgi:hypothetical protein